MFAPVNPSLCSIKLGNRDFVKPIKHTFDKKKKNINFICLHFIFSKTYETPCIISHVICRSYLRERSTCVFIIKNVREIEYSAVILTSETFVTYITSSLLSCTRISSGTGYTLKGNTLLPDKQFPSFKNKPRLIREAIYLK